MDRTIDSRRQGRDDRDPDMPVAEGSGPADCRHLVDLAGMENEIGTVEAIRDDIPSWLNLGSPCVSTMEVNNWAADTDPTSRLTMPFGFQWVSQGMGHQGLVRNGIFLQNAPAGQRSFWVAFEPAVESGVGKGPATYVVSAICCAICGSTSASVPENIKAPVRFAEHTRTPERRKHENCNR